VLVDDVQQRLAAEHRRRFSLKREGPLEPLRLPYLTLTIGPITASYPLPIASTRMGFSTGA
jgi:hypothetical protein